MRIFNRLTLTAKLIISSLMFSLPIAVLLYFVISGFDDRINFSKWEMYGNKYLKPLSRLLEKVPALRWSFLNGNSSEIEKG
ncbi:MAG: hypothetical protein AB1403_21605 [Candidatus Riflebacteria bacterium]